MKKKDIIGLIGLGYVGLPLYLELNKKYLVYGFDKDSNKINSLKNRNSYISDISQNHLKKINTENLFQLKDYLEKISECKYLIFCLPTPLKKNKPDMSYIKSAFNTVFPYLKKRQTIILESSVYPGATEEIFLKKLKSNFNVGKNFFFNLFT